MNGKDIFHGLQHLDNRFVEEAEFGEFSKAAFYRDGPEGRKKTGMGRLPLIAAIIALMLFLMGCAIAALRLNHMTIDVPSFFDYWGEERSILSLQGFAGSKNYEAFQEWQQFLESYDPDKAILYANNDFYLEMPDAYSSYQCYSWEMVEKIDEICEKYGLEPLGKLWVYRQPEHIFEAIGIESAFSDRAVGVGAFSGYCFPGGTFEMEGRLDLTRQWGQSVHYSYRSVKKNAFDGVFSTVGDPETYDQWEYTMNDGTRVLLVLRSAEGETTDEGRVIVDKEDCFVVVSAFGRDMDIFGTIPNDRAFMEDFCEAFDFTYTARQVDPDRAYALECEEEPHTYAAWIDYLLKDPEQSRIYPNLYYALLDINGDGQEELLLQTRDNPFLNKHPFEENMFFSVMGMRNGALVDVAGGGYCYLCKGNVLEFLSPFEGEEERRSYQTYDQHYRYEPVEDILPRDGKLYRQVKGEMVEITQAEADAIIAQFPRVDLAFKPAAEFRQNEGDKFG